MQRISLTETGLRRVSPIDWMSRVDWLVERASRIEARIREVESTGRAPRRPSYQRARRDALAVIKQRIAELEAEQARPVLDAPASSSGA